MFRRTARASASWATFLPLSLVVAAGCSETPSPTPPAPGGPAASTAPATTGGPAQTAATFRPGQAALPFPVGGAPKGSGGVAPTSAPAATAAAPVGPPGPAAPPAAGWTLLKQIPACGTITALAASPKGDFVVGCGPEGVERWEVPAWTPSPKPLEDAPKSGTVVAVSPLGDWIAVASGAAAAVGKIHLWQAPFDGKPTILSGHFGAISALAWSPTAPLRLASGGVDREIRLWNPADPKAKPQVFAGHRDYISQIVFAPNGESFITASGDKTLSVWNLADSKPVRTFTQHLTGVSCLAASSDGRRIAAGETAGAIFVWDASKGEVLGVIAGHGSVVTALAFRPGAATEFASVGGDGRLRIWDTETRRLVGEGFGAKDYLNSVAFGADGGWICAAGEEARVFVWTAPAK